MKKNGALFIVGMVITALLTGCGGVDDDVPPPQYCITYCRNAWKYHVDTDFAEGADFKTEWYLVGTEHTLRENPFTLEGYVFDFWTTEEDGTGTRYEAGQVVKDLGTQDLGISLYAQWKAVEVTVVFYFKELRTTDSMGATMENQVFTHDEAQALKKNTLLRGGFVFTGWNTKPDGSGTSYADEEVITISDKQNQLNLYAQWQAIPCTVIYDANGGEGTTKSETFTFDGTNNWHSIRESTFTRAGYTFAGWNTKADGTGTAYTLDGWVTRVLDERAFVENTTVTLYAQWATHIIVFDANGGEGFMENLSTTDNNITVPQNTFTKEGYEFIGWTTTPKAEDSFNNMYQAGNTYTFSSSGLETVTLYAQWKPNVRTIIFHANYGDDETKTQIERTEEVVLQPNTFIRAGYTFKGWSPTSGRNYGDGDWISLPPDTTLTLYATWEANWTPYTVRYWHQHVYDDAYDLDHEEKETGYTDGTAHAFLHNPSDFECVLPIEQKKIAGDGSTILNVYYTRRIYGITLDLNGGTSTTALTDGKLYGRYGAAVSFENPTKPGYVFLGWNTRGGTLPDTFTNSTITYTALWTTTHATSVTVSQYSDITITPTQNDAVWNFTADNGYEGYTWYVDDKKQTSTKNTCSIDTTGWAKGVYEIRLEAKTYNSQTGYMYYSAAAYITVGGK